MIFTRREGAGFAINVTRDTTGAAVVSLVPRDSMNRSSKLPARSWCAGRIVVDPPVELVVMLEPICVYVLVSLSVPIAPVNDPSPRSYWTLDLMAVFGSARPKFIQPEDHVPDVTRWSVSSA